ncbi:MAG: neutral/alkaline non-lysosomal ceramidase N-terminal domain-containing protein [bacterium]|nr:neutral/alkaline non-lysosomal ceramidase N-terminal domain-containing protein [bacterium]
MFEAGEGTADITPALGLELAGFHKVPGNERRVTGVRQPTAAKALVLRDGDTTAAIIVLELIGFSADFAQKVKRQVSQRTRIPVGNIHVCATHTHSSPTLLYLRQWGALSEEYAALVRQRAVAAAVAALGDVASADCYIGSERVNGGNFNRTSKTWKTDAEFDSKSTDAGRWLDTTLQALYFVRNKPKRDLLWYHFSAHPVCYTDGLAGPDWPGIVATKTLARDELSPVFMQGHAGDVNPGPGTPWLGEPEQVSEAVYAALHHATNHSRLNKVDKLRLVNGELELPLDLELLKEQLAAYEANPAACTNGEWVDAGFAADWFTRARQWKDGKSVYSTPLSALRLGGVGILFHPAELYSYYGMRIRFDSPFPHTLAAGYADDAVGYVTDPSAYTAKEYAAVVVPRILDLPPFRPEAAQTLTDAALRLLRKLA